MTDSKYCPLRFREYGSNPIDQECIGESCAWFGKCSNDAKTPESDVMSHDDGSNDGNADADSLELGNAAQEPRDTTENACSQDSREKLEACIVKQLHEWSLCGLIVSEAHRAAVGWLDRQMALTSREWSGYMDEAIEQLNEASEKVDDLTAECSECVYKQEFDRIDELEAENAKLSSDELHWHSESDYWKRQYELICRAVEDVARNYCVDEGLA